MHYMVWTREYGDTSPLLYHTEYLHFPKSTPHIHSISISNSSQNAKKKKGKYMYRTFSQTLVHVLQSRKCNLNFNLADSDCYRNKMTEQNYFSCFLK